MLQMKALFWLLCFGAVGLTLSDGKRNFKIILKKCEFNIKHPLILRNASCSVGQEATKAERTFLSGYFELSRNITDFDLHLSFDMLRKDNTKINLLSQDINGCKFLESIYSHMLLRNVLQELRRASNLPKKCPVISHTTYSINHFVVNEEDYPAFLPSLSFVFYVKFYIDKNYEGELILNGRVKKI